MYIFRDWRCIREGLRFGNLSYGLALGGASYLNGNNGLTNANGNIGGRISEILMTRIYGQ